MLLYNYHRLEASGSVHLSKYKVKSTITLDNQGATSSGTTEIFEINTDGFYLDNTFLDQMTPSTNPIIILDS